jgi:hypothetical protein
MEGASVAANSLSFKSLLTSLLKNSYKGSLTNFTDENRVVFDPLYNLEYDSWYTAASL